MSNTEVERSAPAVAETMEKRAQKLKGLQVMIGATSGVPEAIDLARSRFVEAYGRAPLHDDLAYACLLIDAYGRAPAAPVPHGWTDGVLAVADMLKKKADAFADAHGHDDMGSVSFGKGSHADAKLDHHSHLLELEEEVRAALAAAPQPPDAFQTEGGLKSEIRTTKDPAFWRACDLLSMTIGTLMGFRQKLGYTDKSPIAGLVNDAVKFLEPWPEKLPTATKPPEADGRKTVSILSGKEAVFAIDILGGPMREYATGKWENAVWPSEAAPMQMPEPVAHLWQHGETGRTRVVMPDAITDCDAQWQLVGGLHTEQQVRQLLSNHGIKANK